MSDLDNWFENLSISGNAVDENQRNQFAEFNQVSAPCVSKDGQGSEQDEVDNETAQP